MQHRLSLAGVTDKAGTAVARANGLSFWATASMVGWLSVLHPNGRSVRAHRAVSLARVGGGHFARLAVRPREPAARDSKMRGRAVIRVSAWEWKVNGG